VEVGARVDAMESASQQFARGYSQLGDLLLAAQRACERAAAATGDARSTARIVAFSDQLSATLDDTCGRLLDVAAGLRRVLEAIWSAGGGAASGGVTNPVGSRRQGGPR